MLTQFRLENFKGHRDTQLTLQQLTVLVGDNSSGKTSVLEALRVPGLLVNDLRRDGGLDVELPGAELTSTGAPVSPVVRWRARRS